MRRFFIGRILSVILFSVVVLGAPPTKAQTPTGLNIGILLSHNWVDMDVREFDTTVMPPDYEVGQVEFNEFGATVLVGYDLRVLNFIVGVIADLTLADFSDNYDGHRYSADWLATLRARAGMELMPGVMGYVTGGLAWMDASYVGEVMMGPVALARDSTTLTGWVVGLGADIDTGFNFGIGPVIIRGEYLYGEFGKWRFWAGPELYVQDTSVNILRIGAVIPLGIGAGN